MSFGLCALGPAAPIEPRAAAADKSCVHCANTPEQRHTEPFFALCENWGGPYSPPLCRCLSTAPSEARPAVPASVSR